MAIHKIKFFAGRGSRYLAEKIVASYGTKLGESEVLNFSDGEFQPCFLESIRGCTVFVIQSTFPPTDNLMELLMMIDAAKRASAHQVIAVLDASKFNRRGFNQVLPMEKIDCVTARTVPACRSVPSWWPTCSSRPVSTAS